MSSPVDPKRWHTREDSGIRLDRTLKWWHDGQAIEHPKIIEAFNRGLSPTDDGRYRLDFGKDWCFVEVEDAAYAVLAIDGTDDDAISIRLSDRTAERLAVDSLVCDAEGVLSCSVKKGRAKARFSRDAQYAFGSMLEASPDGGPVALRVGSRLLPLPPQTAAVLRL